MTTNRDITFDKIDSLIQDKTTNFYKCHFCKVVFEHTGEKPLITKNIPYTCSHKLDNPPQVVFCSKQCKMTYCYEVVSQFDWRDLNA